MKALQLIKNRIYRNEKGTALLMVLMVMMVLLTLGMGLLALTMGSYQQAKSTDIYEKAYYVAAGGTQQGVEYVHKGVLDAYNNIVAQLRSNNTAGNNATSFFDELNKYITNASTKFHPIQSDKSSAASINFIETKIEMSSDTGDTRYITVTTTATTGSVGRKSTTRFPVTFKPVKVTAAAFTPLGTQAVLSGGKFDASGGYVSINGDALFGDLAYKNWNFAVNSITYNTSNPPPTTLIDTTLPTKLTWQMKYPGFAKEAVTAVTPTFGRQIAEGETINNNSFKPAPYNGTVPSPLYLEGQSGASFTVDSNKFSGFTYGQINCSGELTLTGPATGSSSSYVKLYSQKLQQTSGTLNYVKIFADSDATFGNGPSITNSYIYSKGNVTFSGRTLNNLTIICDGNLTITGGSSTNLTIYCKGTIKDSSNTRTNVLVYCDRYIMSGGSIQGDSIVYAENYLQLESTLNGLFYTNGDINLTRGGSGITGQMAAKGTITTTGYTFTYDKNLLARLNVNPFVSSSPADASIKIIQPFNTDIFPSPANIIEE